MEVAKEVVELCKHANYFKFVYDEKDTLWDKMKAVATKIYGASEITADSKVRGQIKQLQESGYGHYPICVAKTQYSFSTDPKLRGAPHGHVVNIREVRLAAGAEFVVMICGDIMTMPGLPATPAANNIDVTDDGKITGSVLRSAWLAPSSSAQRLRRRDRPRMFGAELGEQDCLRGLHLGQRFCILARVAQHDAELILRVCRAPMSRPEAPCERGLDLAKALPPPRRAALACSSRGRCPCAMQSCLDAPARVLHCRSFSAIAVFPLRLFEFARS